MRRTRVASRTLTLTLTALLVLAPMTLATPASAVCTEISDEPCCDQPGADIPGCEPFYESTGLIFIASGAVVIVVVLFIVRGRRRLSVGRERSSDP